MDKELKILLNELYNFFNKKLLFSSIPKVILRKDVENSKNIFGITGYYDPNEKLIVIYSSNRHPKDILRSFSHELIHHHQNCSGKNINYEGKINQNNELREIEKEAYELGNLYFRDWEEEKKFKNNGN